MHRREWLLVGGLVVVALGLRLVWLGRVPPGVRFDELVNVKMADHIYAGEWPIYFQEAWGHEPLYHYFHAAGMSLLGKTVLGARITSILFGTLGVLTTYLAVRVLFGHSVAAATGLFLATSFWSLMYSRVGLRHISLTPWIGLTVYCFWRGLGAPLSTRWRGHPWFALGGVCLGVMLYTYFASRVVPVIFAFFTLYLLVFHRPMLRGRWPGLLLFFVLPALIVTPMVLYLRQHPELERRMGQVGGELFAALRAGNALPLLRAVTDTLKMFSVQGDPEWLYNISGRPVFDPLTALLFYGGVAFSFWHWRDPRRAFILLWLSIGIAPAMLSWPPGSLGHTIAAQPAAYVFPALALIAIWQWAAGQAHRWIQWGGRLAAISVTLVFVLQSGYDYFLQWPRYPEVRHEYQAPITAAARYVKDLEGSTPVCISAPYVDYWNPWSVMNFDLYSPDVAVRVCWFNASASALYPGASMLFPGGAEVLYILPDHILLPSVPEAELGPLLLDGTRSADLGYVAPNGAILDTHLWQDRRPLQERLASVASAELWASPEGPYAAGDSEQQRQRLSVPLDFGRHLSFLGYAYERAEAAAGEPWRMTTYWRVLDTSSSGSHEPLAIFVHVLDDSNAVTAGWDGLYLPPGRWRAGDIFAHVHVLTLPSELPAGPRRVELGVYSPVSQERLQILLGEQGQTAPHNRVLLRPLDIRQAARVMRTSERPVCNTTVTETSTELSLLLVDLEE